MTDREERFKSLREAILEVLITAAGPVPAKDIISRALELHPLAGKTPRATAAAQLAVLLKAGDIARPKRAVYSLPEHTFTTDMPSAS